MRDRLEPIVRDVKRDRFARPGDVDDARALGIIVAKYCDFEAVRIVDAARAALEDAHCQRLSDLVRGAWEEERGRWERERRQLLEDHNGALDTDHRERAYGLLTGPNRDDSLSGLSGTRIRELMPHVVRGLKQAENRGIDEAAGVVEDMAESVAPDGERALLEKAAALVRDRKRDVE
jgi:hypothetical protein